MKNNRPRRVITSFPDENKKEDGIGQGIQVNLVSPTTARQLRLRNVVAEDSENEKEERNTVDLMDRERHTRGIGRVMNLLDDMVAKITTEMSYTPTERKFYTFERRSIARTVLMVSLGMFVTTVLTSLILSTDNMSKKKYPLWIQVISDAIRDIIKSDNFAKEEM